MGAPGSIVSLVVCVCVRACMCLLFLLLGRTCCRCMLCQNATLPADCVFFSFTFESFLHHHMPLKIPPSRVHHSNSCAQSGWKLGYKASTKTWRATPIAVTPLLLWRIASTWPRMLASRYTLPVTCDIVHLFAAAAAAACDRLWQHS